MGDFHLHLVSDSTGETVISVTRACLVQFGTVKAISHLWNMVRDSQRLAQVIDEIEAYPGLVVSTFVDPALQKELSQACTQRQIPCVGLLEPILEAIEGLVGQAAEHRPGRQHEMDDAYYRRIDAMEYSLAHDDGQNLEDLKAADVVLVGVSRTSKTPTCLYLANRGIRAANVPLVPGRGLPPAVDELEGKLIVGLTNQPERLVDLRRTRLAGQGQNSSEYLDLAAVKNEVALARRLFQDKGWPVIDVTHRAIEETAAEIMMLHARRTGMVS